MKSERFGMGEVVLIASGNGGVGKTTMAANLGASLALRGARVVLVDLNLGLRNLDLYLGLENQVLFDIVDVLSGLCTLSKSLIRDSRFPELYLLPGAQCKEIAGLTDAHVTSLLTKLKSEVDYVIADGPAGISEPLKLAAAGVDRSIVLVTPDHSALRNGDMVDRKLGEMGVRNRFCVVNKVKPDLFGREIVPDLEDIASVLDIPMAGAIPYDENIHIANNCGYPVACERNSYIAANFDRISQRLFA